MCDKVTLQQLPHDIVYLLSPLSFPSLPFLSSSFSPPQGYIFTSGWFRRLLRVLKCKRKPHNRYKHVLADLEPEWPPIARDNAKPVNSGAAIYPVTGPYIN